MKGVTFGDYHSFDDLHLLLQDKEIGSPEPKTNEVDVGGIDGVIDLTEALNGFVVYSNRKLKFTFLTMDRDIWLELYSEVLKHIHGQKMNIILDDDSQFFYVGRPTVNGFSSSNAAGTIVVECDCEPYKYDMISSLEDWEWDTFNFETDIVNETANLTVNGRLTVTIAGKQKRVCPKITVSTAMQLVIDGVSYPLAAGDNIIYQCVISEGDNDLVFVGSGTVSIEYRGGCL